MMKDLFFFKKYNLLLLSHKTYIIIFFLTIYFITFALLYGLFISKADFQQGENSRIIYLHVTSAWISLIFYFLLSLNSLFSLSLKGESHPIFRIFAISFAQIGVVFTVITLFTGSFWGVPIWGRFWVWDARLTSVLVLFFLYLTYLILSYYYKKNSIPSIFALIGCLNLPIIKYSVDWWNTLHQLGSIDQIKISIHFSILIPLLLMVFGLLNYTILILTLFVRESILKEKINSSD